MDYLLITFATSSILQSIFHILEVISKSLKILSQTFAGYVNRIQRVFVTMQSLFNDLILCHILVINFYDSKR